MWLTGVAWLALHFYGRTEGDYGPLVNPLEPLMLQMHGLFLIPALLSLGGILFSHIGLGWRQVFKRLSGLTLLATFIVLTVSGYFLYYAGDQMIRAMATYSHWGVGIAAPAPFIWHLLVRINRNRQQDAPPPSHDERDINTAEPAPQSGYKR